MTVRNTGENRLAMQMPKGKGLTSNTKHTQSSLVWHLHARDPCFSECSFSFLHSRLHSLLQLVSRFRPLVLLSTFCKKENKQKVKRPSTLKSFLLWDSWLDLCSCMGGWHTEPVFRRGRAACCGVNSQETRRLGAWLRASPKPLSKARAVCDVCAS